MSAATAVKSPSHVYGHHSSSRPSRPSTTPRSPPGPASVGQPMPPIRSPSATGAVGSGTGNSNTNANTSTNANSPSYFGLVVAPKDSLPLDSAAGHHSRQNWVFPDYRASSSAVKSPGAIAPQANTNYDAFRTQSERGSGRFHLSSSVAGVSTPAPQHEQQQQQQQQQHHHHHQHHQHHHPRASLMPLDIPRSQSPLSTVSTHNVRHHEHARLSLPVNDLKAAAAAAAVAAASSSACSSPTTATAIAPLQGRRSDTLPPSPKDHEPRLVGPQAVAALLRRPGRVLILDLRVFHQCAAARLRGALNLCIPTTLLKRPSFTLRRLAETFSRAADRERFERWHECDCIVVYDASSSQAKEAVTCFNVLKKFASEGWDKDAFVIKGGFHAFARLAPDLVDSSPIKASAASPDTALSIAPPDRHALAVAGGCTMPATESAANPFFSNIRQNMDLVGGVGQIPIKRPRNLSEHAEGALPAWLRTAARPSDQGKRVSDSFLAIEKQEQKRMHKALSARVAYGRPTATPQSPTPVQVAGIEMGSKNRYDNVFPFDHCRVRLQGVARGDCDYINASHVKAEYSSRRYIAAQAPLPSTFDDFWRVVWQQRVSVIVMLTAECEAGQLKSHAYWRPAEYGPLKTTLLSERTVSLEPRPLLFSSSSSSSSSSTTTTSVSLNNSPVSGSRPTMAASRRTTSYSHSQPVSSRDLSSPTSPSSPPPSVILRTVRLAHSAAQQQPRDIIQLQYTQWPDFGAPTSPSVLLALINLVNKCVNNPPTAAAADEPILVHCSAGCGRTGTFCTIDSVIDMLRRQQQTEARARRRRRRADGDGERMDVDHDEAEAWLHRDDEDLIAKTVADFRHQRLSMVQNLRQFVLCYETVLQWLANELPQTPRKSSQLN